MAHFFPFLPTCLYVLYLISYTHQVLCTKPFCREREGVVVTLWFLCSLIRNRIRETRVVEGMVVIFICVVNKLPWANNMYFRLLPFFVSFIPLFDIWLEAKCVCMLLCIYFISRFTLTRKRNITFPLLSDEWIDEGSAQRGLFFKVPVKSPIFLLYNK